MNFVYNILIRFYGISIGIVSSWNPKANQWIKGRKNWELNLRNALQNMQNIHWFHCASLGEFEQARPLIEKIKLEKPETPILVSFFSPSGYEIRKSYHLADYVCYMPLDTFSNAKRFVNSVNISKVFFVKYEVWPNFFKQLKKRRIPLYLISATFREKQIYFKSGGKWFRKLLEIPTQIFVQDEASKVLLDKHNIGCVVSGDTRFDRVVENAKRATPIPEVEQFIDGKFTIVLGSCWEQEEEMMTQHLKTESSIKVIFATHDVGDSHINGLTNRLSNVTEREINFIKFSEVANESDLSKFSCLIIDNIGMLSNLYQYALIAFVGGGFTNALHNILEPAAYGIPVLYGDSHGKFPEGEDMYVNGGGIPIRDFGHFNSQLSAFFYHPKELKRASDLSARYIKERVGATDLIYSKTTAS